MVVLAVDRVIVLDLEVADLGDEEVDRDYSLDIYLGRQTSNPYL